MREKLLLAGLALAAFGASLGGSFQFDDFALFSDPAVVSPSGWWESWRLEQTRPLTWFTFWISYQLGGEHAAGYHAVSLALHAGVVLLLFDVLARVLPARAALAGAAVFAVHPLLGESVNYVFARGTLLAALFSLLAVRAWIRERWWGAVGWFAAAMLAKEECAALPVFLWMLDRRDPEVPRRPGGLPYLAMLGVAMGLGLRVVWATSAVAGSQAGAQAGISPIQYFLAQGVVIWRYLRMVVVPWGFTVDTEIARPQVWLGLLAWVALLVLVGWVGLKFRAGFWLMGAVVLLLPSSSIFPAADLAADRRMYLPMLVLCVGVGLIAGRLDGRMLAAVVFVMAGISLRYSLVWGTPESLWTEAVKLAPSKVRPRLQLARAVDPAGALSILEEARRLAPEDASVAAEQGRVLLTLGRVDEALGAFGRALALDPGDARAVNNRGAALLALGQTDAARADFERALARDTCLFDARLNLRRMGVRTLAAGCRYTPGQRAALGE